MVVKLPLLEWREATLPPAMPPFPVARFTLDEYHRIIALGGLTEDDNIELIEGWLVKKMSRNTPHDVCLQKLTKCIFGLLPPDWGFRGQSAITIGMSEPEPDGAIVLEPADRYLAHHPLPEEIAVLVEVANTSLENDRQVKGRIYARAGIAIYWIVNLIDRQVEVYTSPLNADEEPRYSRRQDYRDGDSLPVVIQGQEVGRIAVRDLLPLTPAPSV